MKNNHGFTLVELMITLAVAAILLGVAVPSFRDTIQNNRLATSANELVATINTARSEAIKRGDVITVCSSADSATCKTSGVDAWEDGWIIFADTDADGTVDAGETVIRVHNRSENGVTIRGRYIASSGTVTNAGRISYSSTGFKSTTEHGTFTVCDNRGASEARAVLITPMGGLSSAIDSDGDGTVNHDAAGSTANVTCP